MPPFFSNKKLIVLLTCLTILVALIGFSLKERNEYTWPEQFIHDTVGFFQLIFNRPAQYAAGFFETIDDIQNVYRENELLKSRLKHYAEIKTLYHQLKVENKKLRQQLELMDSHRLTDYKKHIALVIGRSYDKWNQLLIVNKGSQAGIQPGMAVMTPKGLIGTVSRVSQFTSEVSLITDPTNLDLIPAMITSEKGNIFGLIEGYAPDKNVLLFKKLPIDAKIKKGMRVVTSGLGGVYPQGLYIGKVAAVRTSHDGLAQIAEIKPAADFNHLYYVDIIERLAVSGNTGESGDDAS